MPLTDLRYRLSEEGRVVLGQLTKYHGPAAQKWHEPRRADCTSPTASGRYAQAMARRKVLRSIAMMVIVSLMCAGLAAIVFLAD